MMVIEPANTNIALGDRWGARHWNNCCQPAARRMTSSFTKATNEHRKILNPPPGTDKRAGYWGYGKEVRAAS